MINNYKKKLIKSFFSMKFIKFVLFSAIAALVNLASRALFHKLINIYWFSIIIAYIFGMATAFLLNKYLNFNAESKSIHFEIINFIVINLFGLIQTLMVSLFLANILFYYMHIIKYKYFIAHLIGVGAPIFSSFLGHKYITFGKYNLKEIFTFLNNKK